jgi:hypothetical protein
MSSALFADGSEETRDLPRWALVAFAARCARRLRAVCEELAPDCPQDVLAGYDEYTLAIEQAAASARPAPEWPPSRSATVWCQHPETLTTISFVLTAAAGVHHFASRPLRDALSVEDGTENEAKLRSLFSHMISNLKAAAKSSQRAHSLVRGMNRDLQRLKRAAAEEGWTDETPVPPEFFGAL